ncbi:putative pentatricopeptide repeat-containing protein [Cucumis melo var. makuwa]|uniref:Pentatricopeptide repeat-containing protein At1g56570 n=2 Tax=Cucumis melo TaxID=3656 RepID=A0A1S3BQ30_CUCME|nr:putative pentatricopeptide repeat-containing protein At1g56570 [Cucumis melo]XP_008450531.1 putative pentatricopeptide repeat-containing protein At1g56570 [Cucumis melo]XP_008450532.1 putative pentatricopeptide repeat-containing protein At1g56570 [Cucumis melo]XP_050937169.1 putative pentatricopeptide repeat-containing protein At1g56570 [Cucumis melo]XP_050937170.1 putative pentatricopeptide repeat-containing protein At1g56570 [Cucumis melo]XP_050937171.1 putative pentatricopeptide repeat-c
MSVDKLASSPHFHPIPLIVRNSLQWISNSTLQSNPPFTPKGPSFWATNLIKSYFDKGLTREACNLFNEIPERDVVTWTAMIVGFTSCNHYPQAWTMFSEMLRSEVQPNAFTMSSVLKACKGMKALSCGALAHSLATKLGIDRSVYVQNALLDMYAASCATMDDALSVFNDIPLKTAVSWTTLIAGLTHRGDGYSGLLAFRKMLLEDVGPNSFSFSIAARACASISSYSCGKQIHAAVTKYGLHCDAPVMNSILDMYCRCNYLCDAKRCFDELTEKNLITWNTLIAGYERSDSSESLSLFFQMGSEGYKPNCFTFTSITAACANLAVLSCGQQVHGGIVRRGFDKNVALINSLIDMYAKCGSINDSHKLFCDMPGRDLVSWTTMMIGYGTHGYGKEAVKLFDEMVQSGIQPDRIVFMGVLSGCSHAGLVDRGLKYFRSMLEDYNINPDQEIYRCVVDLLGRAGRVEEAFQLVENMPFEPDESVWGALLGACKACKLSNLGNLAAQRVLGTRPNMAGTYLLLSNIYAAEGKWGEFAKMRKLMKGMDKKKEVGKSWIEIRNEVYSFVVGAKMGPHIEWVHKVIDVLIWHMKDDGDVADLNYIVDYLEGT